MRDIALETQDIVSALANALNVLPSWVVLLLLAAPTVASLAARNFITVLSTLILNATCLVLIALESSTALPLAVVSFAAALVFALFGIRERLLWQNLAGLEVRIGHIDEQAIAFLRALERRSDSLDQYTAEARTAFQEARRVFEESRRAVTVPARVLRTDISRAQGRPPAGGPANAPGSDTAPALANSPRRQDLQRADGASPVSPKGIETE
jgi:hypothetical protein